MKRTALGRFKHEGAMVTLPDDGRVVVYMGDDERFDYIYKFISKGKVHPNTRAANRDLLDEGTLYVARFDAHGAGQWLALRGTAPPLIAARLAADQAGATMDRPEWIAVHPVTQEVYVAPTNNSRRGSSGQPGPDPANPRASNVYGHIVKWREQGGDAAATMFRWDMFALAGEDKGFGSPDGRWFDPRGSSVDPDRRLHQRAQSRTVREDRKQPDGRRCHHRGNPPLPHRTRGMVAVIRMRREPYPIGLTSGPTGVQGRR